MRALLLAALLLPSCAAAGEAEGTPALWNRRQPPLQEAQLEGLRKLGYRLEPDGIVMDSRLRTLGEAGLEEALRLLDAGETGLRLEHLRHLLAGEPQDRPLSAAARERALLLAGPGLSARLADPATTAGQLRAFAELDLSQVSAAFDGGAGRGGPGAVAAGPTAARPHLPYLTPAEQRAGESLRAAAAARLGALERGRLILSRLNGADGRPELPPILVEDIGGNPARYDYVRRALVLNRDLVVTALLANVPPADRDARRRELARPDALAAALAADPAAAARVAASNDVLLAHELTHAWQDRRDPLFRQMVRNQIPRALVLEYEEEAHVEKNLYLHELLRAAPGTYVEPDEMSDYQAMISRYDSWRNLMIRRYRSLNEASVADFEQLVGMQQQRLLEAQAAPEKTLRDQRVRAANIGRLNAGAAALNRVRNEHAIRMTNLGLNERSAVESGFASVMARHELHLALSATNFVLRSVSIGRARRFAQASGDEALQREIDSRFPPDQ